jgi:ATP-binding cassette subfamily B protein
VLADGRIIEDGTHEQLLEGGGTYATMFRLQAERYISTETSEVVDA